MVHLALLVVHIAGACVMGVAALYSIDVLRRSKEIEYRRCAAALGVLAGFEVVTGLLLSVVSVHVSAPAVCRDVALYISIWAALEAVLFMRMRRGAIAYPFSTALYPVIVGLFTAAALAPYVL